VIAIRDIAFAVWNGSYHLSMSGFLLLNSRCYQ